MQCIYQHIKDKKIYQIDNNQTPKTSKNDHKAYNTYHTKKDYNKLQVNFKGIKFNCGRCLPCFLILFHPIYSYNIGVQ